MPKFLLVAIREYIKVVRKPTFWLATLLLPAFIVVVSLVSNETALSSQKKLEEEAQKAQSILIYDASGVLDPASLSDPFSFANSQDAGIEAIQTGQADAFFVYPKDFLTSGEITIYVQNDNVIANTRYNQMASLLIKQNVLNQLGNPQISALVNAQFKTTVVPYQNGAVVKDSIPKLILPALVILLYFLSAIFALSFLLMSVAEEKENRMIEIVLSAISSKSLIGGKILGQVGVVLTQVFLFVTLAVLAFFQFHLKLPIELQLSDITVNVGQLSLSLFYFLMGFLFLANAMVGIGAAMPNYKDAQQFSGVFILLALLPLYFITVILTDPNGLVAIVTSYLPFTSAFVLMMRNALVDLPLWEILLSIFVSLFYVALSFVLAYKVFELGSLEHNKRVDIRRVFSRAYR